MLVLAFLAAMFAVLAPLAWWCDRRPTDDDMSVAEHQRTLRALTPDIPARARWR